MGYSCTAAASKTEELWERACVAQTNASNTWHDENGRWYFYERGRENADGAITGAVFAYTTERGMNGQAYAHRSGTYRIEPDGTVTRAPAFLKAASKARDTWLRADPANREAALKSGA